MPSDRDLLPVLARVRRRLAADVSLDALARASGWSPFHLHRAFRRVTGETPKQYTQRLRLDGAAARLLAGEVAVLDVALASGFSSHEVFTRAFRRRFGRSPVTYRAAFAGAAVPSGDAARHRAVTGSVGPCLRLFRMSAHHPAVRRFPMSAPSIERREVESKPVLFIRRRVARAEIAAAIGDCLGKVFGHCQAAGIALAGPPFSRYPEAGPGLLTIDVGMPLAAPADGSGEIESGTLQGGAVAFTVHAGSYDSLAETYAAIERWMEAQGVRPGGPPWEVYVTDPAEHPDPADWRTEIYWPLA